LNYTRGSGVIL